MSSVPITRSLPYVLRESLESSQHTGVMIGRVTAVPDNAHVTVDLQGSTITIPKLKSYGAPVVGEPVFVLTDPLYTVALGSVSATPPPGISNADLLDSIDSTGFLQRKPAGGEQIWWGLSSASMNAAGVAVHPHGLGRVPALVMVTRSTAPSLGASSGAPMVTARDASTVTVQLPGISGAGTMEIWLLVIG